MSENLSTTASPSMMLFVRLSNFLFKLLSLLNDRFVDMLSRRLFLLQILLDFFPYTDDFCALVGRSVVPVFEALRCACCDDVVLDAGADECL